MTEVSKKKRKKRKLRKEKQNVKMANNRQLTSQAEQEAQYGKPMQQVLVAEDLANQV